MSIGQWVDETHAEARDWRSPVKRGRLDLLEADVLVVVILVDGVAEEVAGVEDADFGDIACVVADDDHDGSSDVLR